MSFTYAGPSNSDRDAVRFTIGDTDEDNYLFEDDELDYLLNEENNSIVGAAAAACEILSTRFARKVNRTLDGTISESLSQLSKAYKIQAKELRDKQKNEKTRMSGSFISQDAINRERRFTSGQFDNPGAD